MNDETKQTTATTEARGMTREEVITTTRDDASILREVLDRMNVIEMRQSRPSPVKLQTWEEIERFAEKAARSGMVPKDYIGKPDAICIAVQMGSELGLPPMQALNNIAVVNGRPSVWGDAMPGLCRASGMVKSIREWSEGEDDDLTFYCEAIRKDDPNPITGKFSVQDAKRANLWKTEPKVTKRGQNGTYEADSGVWYSYPHRMLQMRARGFALRDAFPDVLRGLISAEEAADIPFEATGLTPRVEPMQAARQEPVRKPEPPTEMSWLEALDAQLAAEPNGTRRLKLLDAALANVPTLEDAEAVAMLPSVRVTYESAPEMLRERINDMLKKPIDRLRAASAETQIAPEPDFIPAMD